MTTGIEFLDGLLAGIAIVFFLSGSYYVACRGLTALHSQPGRHASDQFAAGYRWAKNSHESGDLTLDEIEAYCFNQDHPFDAGARNYLQRQGMGVEL